MGKPGKSKHLSKFTNWVAHPVEMRRSPAWRFLPDTARRVLDVLEVAHMEHGAADNGNLAVPYDDFAKQGIRRGSVALALRQCEALGFLEKQTFGYAHGNGPKRLPNRYFLTYLNGRGNSRLPTDAWERIKTDDDARAALARAKQPEAAPRSTKRAREADEGDNVVPLAAYSQRKSLGSKTSLITARN